MLDIYADGASRGNPGESGAGAVLFDANGDEVATTNMYLGVTTNNVAEYYGAMLGLAKALQLGAERVNLHLDSELVVKQLRGEYSVRSPDLLPLHNYVREILSHFRAFDIVHVKREFNAVADRAANEAIDQRITLDDYA